MIRGRRLRRWLLATGLATVFCWFWWCLPDPLFRSPSSFVIEDAEGRLLGAAIAADGQWRFPASTAVPEKFATCIVAFEDSHFRHHPGVDPLALGRAITQNIRRKSIVSGASTLTMQVIRLSRKKPRTIFQKFVEMIMAVRLELSYSKSEILALYASNAPFGANVVGLDAASWRYYGRNPDQLSWGETAALAVLPNAPALVHPGKNRLRLLKKRNLLIDKLVASHILDPVSGKLAKLEPLPEKPLPLPNDAPHLLYRFQADFGKQHESSTRLRTSIDGHLQQRASDILERRHEQFLAAGINNIAALILDVKTGKVLSYLGNIRDRVHPEWEGNVDMIPARRSPGSTLKPFLYASMLSDGLLLPDALVADVPTQIGGYTPKNFDLNYDGAIPASRALSRSLNVPAVKMLQQYKYPRFYEQLKGMGMTSLDRPADFYGLSLILGGSETSMWELSGIYASMARSLTGYVASGNRVVPAEFRMPTYRADGKPTTPADTRGPAAASLSASAIWFTMGAMQEVMRPGEEGLWQQFSSSRQIAWKTGTSFGFRDGWAIGLTPDHLVCVWVGNADGEGRAGLVGIETAAPVMFELFGLLPASGWFNAPQADLRRVAVCRQSGFRAGPNCPEPEKRWVGRSGLKSPFCPWHQLVHLDASQRWQVNSDCAPPSSMVHLPWFVLPPGMEYYYQKRHPEYRPLPPLKPGCSDATAIRPMELLYPKPRAAVFLPREADGTSGNAIFSVAHRIPGIKLFWYIDESYVGSTVDFHQVAVHPLPGKHVLTLVDERGNRLVEPFEVLENTKTNRP